MTHVDDPTPEDELDPISAAFVGHEAQLRRRTVWLSLLPVVVGVLVVTAAYRGVAGARAELVEVELQTAAIEKSRGILIEEIVDLEEQRAELEKSVAEHQALIDYVEQRLPADEKQTVDYIQTGLRSVADDDYGKAIEEYGKALAIDGDNATLLSYQGTAYYRDGDYRQAVETLQRAVALDPELTAAHYYLALAYWRLERYDAMERAMKRAFALDPQAENRARRDPEFKAIWGYLESRAGRTSAASEPEAELLESARRAFEERRFDEAIEGYRAALELNPNNARAAVGMGRAYFASGRFTEAAASFEKAASLDPERGETRYQLGMALSRTGEIERAHDAFEEAFELDPKLEAQATRDPRFRSVQKILGSKGDG